MTETRSVRHRRAHAAARAHRRYPWVRIQQHIVSPQNDRWRAAAFPDACGRMLFGQVAGAMGQLTLNGEWRFEPARPRPCLRCAHRHHADQACSVHIWGDGCGYDAGSDCPGPGLRPLRLRGNSAADSRRAIAVAGPAGFAPYLGPWLPEHDCPVCGVERPDYEGPGRYLDTCPNCGASESPIEGDMINRLWLWLGLPHWYLSTSCLHAEHRYCQADTGLAGQKRPATCKFCGVNCRCRCHRGHRWGPPTDRTPWETPAKPPAG